jgi:hypothetical protein
MPTLIHEFHEDALQLGNHEVFNIVEMHGTDDLPKGLDGKTLLTLELPSIPIMLAGQEVGRREFYLCYSLQKAFLFVVETEMAKNEVKYYRAQYGANDNYDTSTKVQRIVWLYCVDSPRVKDPVIAAHLQPYLPALK